MVRYCLETTADGAAIIHELNCASYDLGTLLGLGCVIDVGQFATLTEALSAIKNSHPHAVRCPECCQTPFAHLPLIRQIILPVAIVALSD